MAHRQRRRGTIRLRSWDYARPGVYAVTICSRGQPAPFAEIVGARVVLTPAGVVARSCWRAIPRHNPRVRLDAFVIMPDHLHGIIHLTGSVPDRLPGSGAPAVA